ncbi:MAG: hypothetical protein JNM27_16445 [Leptospirales bacterium]|nr:hypothetical protein [Leptospirales bacterium]
MFPHPDHLRDPVNILGYHFDDLSLKLVIDALPDAVCARITNMCDLKLQPRFYRALGTQRMDRMGIVLERETYPDQDKDQIVQNAVTKTVNQLLKQKRISPRGLDYIGQLVAGR